MRNQRSNVALVGENQYGVEDVVLGFGCFIVPLIDGPNISKVLRQTVGLVPGLAGQPACVGRKEKDAAVRVVERDEISIGDCPRAAIPPLHHPVDDTGGNGTSADHEGTSNIDGRERSRSWVGGIALLEVPRRQLARNDGHS